MRHPLRAWQGVVRLAIARAFYERVLDGVAKHNGFDLADPIDLADARAESDSIMEEMVKPGEWRPR